MTDRRVEVIPGGLKVVDANGQSLAYVYSREKPLTRASPGCSLLISSSTCLPPPRWTATPMSTRPPV